MRMLVLAMILAGVGYFGYQHLKFQEVLEARERAHQIKPTPVRNEAKRQIMPKQVRKLAGKQPSERRVSCGFCNAEGQVKEVAVGRRGQAAAYRPCPVCYGKGERTFIVPADVRGKVCPDCKGMARIAMLRASNRVLTTCPATGYAKSHMAVNPCKRCKLEGYIQ